MKSNRKINTVKLLDVVSIGGKSVREFDNELMYLSTGDLEESKIVNLEPVTFDSRPSRANQLVEINDILFAKMKDTRKTLLINENTKNIIVSTGFYVLRASNKVLPKYIYHYLNSDYFLNQKNKLCKGATQKAINNDGLKQIDIVLYDDKIQAKIVELLDKSKELIDKRKEQIKSLDELVKSQFIEMFGDPFKNPKGWSVQQLKEIILLANNGLARRGNDKDGNIVLRLVELQDGFIDYTSPNRIKLTEAEEKRYLLQDGDFLFARVNGNPDNVGRCSAYDDIGESVYHNDHIIRVRFDENIVNNDYVSSILNSPYGKLQMKDKLKTSAGQYTINQNGISEIKITVPPIELQNQFANFVKQTDKLKFEMEKSLKELEDNFSSLMQKSFSGELFN